MDAIDILHHIDDFYNSAWDKLIITGAIIIGAVGFLVPYLFNRHQQRQLILSKEQVEAELKEELRSLKNELNEENKKEIAQVSDKFKKENEEQYFRASAVMHFLQGLIFQTNSRFAHALEEFVISGKESLDVDYFYNLHRVIRNIQLCFKGGISKDEFNKLFEDRDYDYNTFINYISEKDKKKLYTKEIEILKKLPEQLQ